MDFMVARRLNAKERRRRLHGSPPVPNERSACGQTACTHRIRATVTVYSRPIVFSDRNERISKLGDRIVLSTQLQ